MIRVNGINFIISSVLEYSSFVDNNWSSTQDVVGRFFSIVLVFLFVLALAYYATKLVASTKYQKSKTSNIKLVDGMGLGYQSAVQIIKVGNKYILIGVTKENISFLAELPEESIVLPDEATVNYNVPFEKYLKKFLDKNSKGS